jgi:hypothetical protein
MSGALIGVNGIGGPAPIPFGMLDSVIGDAPKEETAMSALTVSEEPEQNWDDLVRFWEEMEWPEGSKVEIIEGIITVSPAPAYRHNLIAERIQRRLYSVIPDDWGVFQTLAIAVPSRLGMLIPDIVVAPRREDTDTDTHIPAALAELVVEVQVQRPPRPHQQTRRLRHRRHPPLPARRPLGPRRPDRDALRRTEGRRLPPPEHGQVRRGTQAPRSLRSRHRHQRVSRRLTHNHPSSAATTTNTGTASIVDSRIASRARTSPTR